MGHILYQLVLLFVFSVNVKCIVISCMGFSLVSVLYFVIMVCAIFPLIYLLNPIMWLQKELSMLFCRVSAISHVRDVVLIHPPFMRLMLSVVYIFSLSLWCPSEGYLCRYSSIFCTESTNCGYFLVQDLTVQYLSHIQIGRFLSSSILITPRGTKGGGRHST